MPWSLTIAHKGLLSDSLHRQGGGLGHNACNAVKLNSYCTYIADADFTHAVSTMGAGALAHTLSTTTCY